MDLACALIAHISFVFYLLKKNRKFDRKNKKKQTKTLSKFRISGFATGIASKRDFLTSSNTVACVKSKM